MSAIHGERRESAVGNLRWGILTGPSARDTQSDTQSRSLVSTTRSIRGSDCHRLPCAFVFFIGLYLSTPSVLIEGRGKLQTTLSGRQEGLSARRSMRRAFSLVELIVGLTIFGLVTGLVVMSVQMARERARHSACLKNLQQLALASSQYATAQGAFPPGTNSYPACVDWDDFRNREPGVFWRKRSQASCLVYLLPYLEQLPIYDLVDASFVARDRNLPLTGSDGRPVGWFVDLPGYWEMSEQMPSTYRCPSDAGNALFSGDYLAGSQPVFKGLTSTDFFSSHMPFKLPTTGGVLLSSSYLGCSGPHSGGIHPDPERDKYRGVMSSGERVRTSQITDGLSNTIAFGETMGEMTNGNRTLGHFWTVGGLVRGRGDWPWLLTPSTRQIMGNSSQAVVSGFASAHTDSVNVAWADGSVGPVAKVIGLRPWYAMCGRSDGVVVDARN